MLGLMEPETEREAAIGQRTYLRLPFELDGDCAATLLSEPPGVSWITAEDDELLTSLLASNLELSIDPREKEWVRLWGSRVLAERMIEDAQAGKNYECERQWWSIVSWDGEAAGFAMPVVFTGCKRDGLDEGTIYHIGVVGEYRGRGLGHLLLARATKTLLDHGVWRIFADTAIENIPMIRVFERQNWIRRKPIAVSAQHHP
jgi:GNAT superfamily N-acetyltransferase